MKFKRKQIRLKEFNYKGRNAYSVTICTHEKQNYFINNRLVDYLLSQLKDTTEQFLFSIYAYCFMPDHLHLLLIGEEGSDLVKCIKIFKQKTGFYFKKEHGKYLWQKSFYEHVLRKEESLNDVALYIFNNPVRKGLVNDFREYPYLGSFVIDVKQL